MNGYSFACWYELAGGDKYGGYPPNGFLISLTSVEKGGIRWENASFGIVNNGKILRALHTSATGAKNYCNIAPMSEAIFKWHFVVSTWDGKYIRVFYDGRIIDSLYCPTSAEFGSEFQIGCGSTRGQHNTFFRGKIDDVAVYDRALTKGEIQKYYKGSLNDAYDRAFTKALVNYMSASSIASRIVNRTFYNTVANGMQTSITFKSEGNPATGAMILKQLGCNFAYVYKINGKTITVDFYKSDCGRVSQNSVLYYNEQQDNIYMYIEGVKFVFTR